MISDPLTDRTSVTLSSLVSTLRANDEDHEFYPTTDAIIEALLKDLEDNLYDIFHHRCDSALDIGAGHGKVLRALHERSKISKLYAIEKSALLRAQLDENIFILGTDFLFQSLLSKKVDMVFSNPPYSEFSTWAVKIIREACARCIYLVIPVRWTDDEQIALAIKFREAKAEVIGEFSFEDAEDRRARAKVHLVRIQLHTHGDDAFERFFNEQFAGLKEKYESAAPTGSPDDPPAVDENRRFASLSDTGDLPYQIVQLYNAEMAEIGKNYELVSQLNAGLLREFDISPKRVMECLLHRLNSLRNAYWRELFSRMRQVTDRLTSKRRNRMLETIMGNSHVDFTVENIHALVTWVLKNARVDTEAQLLEVFDEMVGAANVRNYKSNERVFVFDRWRYQQEKPTHIALEYRIVCERSGGICVSHGGKHYLDDRGRATLQDILTAANNLGFLCKTADERVCSGYSYRSSGDGWDAGSKETFMCKVNGVEEILLEARAYRNGNIHLRLSQDFALALNVEVGRLRGWVRSGAEAAEELGDPKAARYFGSHVQIGLGSLPMLTGGTAA